MAAVSLICTVLNEADNIADLIESIMAQTRPPDEIVINDCGSRDGTVEIIQGFINRGYPIILVHGGRSISTGRNNAIRHAHGPIIVRIDAGLTLEPEFIEKLVEPVEQGTADFAVGHAYVAPQSLFEAVSGDMLYLKLPAVQDVVHAGGWHTPGRNGAAYRLSDWEAVGGYADYLDATEDRVIGLRLRRLGKRYAFVPEARVHFRPRENFRSLFKQHVVYSYWTAFGRSEGQMGLKKIFDYMARIVAGIALPILLMRAFFDRTLSLIFAVGGVAWLAIERYNLRTLVTGWPLWKQVVSVMMAPAIRLTREYARLYGTTRGLWAWYKQRPLLPELPGLKASSQEHDTIHKDFTHVNGR